MPLFLRPIVCNVICLFQNIESFFVCQFLGAKLCFWENYNKPQKSDNNKKFITKKIENSITAKFEKLITEKFKKFQNSNQNSRTEKFKNWENLQTNKKVQKSGKTTTWEVSRRHKIASPVSTKFCPINLT